MSVDAGTLMMVEGEYLTRKVAEGLDEKIMKEPPIHQSQGGISWKAVQTGKEVVINDLKNADVASESLKSGNFHALITVPMMIREQPIGVISIFARDGRNFSEDDINLFKVISNQAALAIISLQSEKLILDNRKRMAELAALNQVSKSVSTLFNFEETLYSIIGLITRQVSGDQGLIVLFDHKEKLLKAVKPAFHLSPNQVRDFRCRSDEGITGQAFCKGILINGKTIDKETNEVLSRAKINNVKSVLAAPLKVKSQTLGVIHVFSNKEGNFDSEDERLMTILSSQAAVVVNSSFIYRQAEEERRKDDALLSSIGEGVLAVDANRDVILLNQAGEQKTGFLEEEMIGRSVEHTLEILDEKKRPIKREDSPIAKVLSDGKPIVLNNIFLKKHDNTYFPARFSVAATRNIDDQIIGAIVVFNDITREIEIEQMKQELISIATHELRTPITGIKGYLDMILAGDTGEISDETKETLKEMVAINQRLADLVDDLLNVGRIEEGRIEIKLQATDINDIIAKVVEELSVQAQEKKLTIEFSKIKVPKVIADPDRTRQILVNLIGNAIKYTESGSITISLEDKWEEIICHIKDTGIGISQEEQKKLFKKFSRIKTEKTRQITGTGLGLWITRQLVEMMGGKIFVTSTEGKGSDFFFSLPASK